MSRRSLILLILVILIMVALLLGACVSSGGGGAVTPESGAMVTPALNDNATTAPLPFPPVIAATMTAGAR
jgi:hypothetical protein